MTPNPTLEELKKFMEWATGIDMDELLNDDERRVTYMEVSMRRYAAFSMYYKTGDKKYLRILSKCDGLLCAMSEKTTEGKSLYLKPSELDSLLAP